MIEARGAKHAYVYTLLATRVRGIDVSVNHAMMLDTADSDDEAFGRAMRAALLAFPRRDGWSNHFAPTKKISGFDWVGRHDFTKIEPVGGP